MAIDIKISSEQTIEHEGKQYRPVAIRSPKQGETFLSAGECYLANADYRDYVSVILEEVIPPYRTPTDEDAKQRPMAEFWGRDESPEGSKQGVLLSELDSSPWPFVGLVDGVVGVYRHCRIANEQKA